MARTRYGLLGVTIAGAVLLIMAGDGWAEGGGTQLPDSPGGSRSGSAMDQDTGERTSPDAQSKGTVDRGFTSQPAGIGERGTGQTQSTLERAGGTRSKPPQEQAPVTSDLSQGKTAQALEEIQEKSR